MFYNFKVSFLSFILILSFINCSSAYAYDEISLEKNIIKLDEINTRLKKNKYTSEELPAWTRMAIDVKSASELCISEKNDILNALKESILGLGEKTKGEDINVASVRKLLVSDKNKVEKEKAQCNVHVLICN